MNNFLGNLVPALILVFNIAILARVILSWVAPNPNNPFSIFVIQITEPILKPIRRGIQRILPNLGMFDFSPMVALVLLNFVIAPILRRLF